MNIVFMGTPQFAATILEELSFQYTVAGVFCAPDAIRGRGKELTPCPVKALATKLDIPVYTPKNFKEEGALESLRALQPDVICVAAYGVLLPKEVLDLPQYGCLNVHASLLPRWRGAAPIERAVLSDDSHVGVCIMLMEEGLDTGPYCVCRKMEADNLSSQELSTRLASLGGQALLTALIYLEKGQVSWTYQDDSQTCYAKKIEKGELNLSYSDTQRQGFNKVRASSDAHPSKISVAHKGLSIIKASIDYDVNIHSVTVGKVGTMGKRCYIGLNDGILFLDTVKPDGKSEMSGYQFACGIQGIKDNKVTWEELG